jgi:hypothetical protein
LSNSPALEHLDASVERLGTALDTDLVHAQAHTRWLIKAPDCESNGRDKSFLLRGSELPTAEGWLAPVGDKAEPAPTALQRAYVHATRTASTRRQRLAVGSSLTAVVVAVVLAVFALISRGRAQTAAAVSQSRALVADSQAQLAAIRS